jgi:hypothetical protein
MMELISDGRSSIKGGVGYAVIVIAGTVCFAGVGDKVKLGVPKASAAQQGMAIIVPGDLDCPCSFDGAPRSLAAVAIGGVTVGATATAGALTVTIAPGTIDCGTGPCVAYFEDPMPDCLPRPCEGNGCAPTS